MIRIVTAYADLMNLYGDYANAVVLQRRLACAGIEAEIRPVSVGDRFDLENADMLLIGAGTEGAMLAALADIRREKAEIEGFIGRGTLLATGNALALFARTIQRPDGETIEGLALGDYDAAITGKRRYAEYILRSALAESPAVGAVNTSIVFTPSAHPMFEVLYPAGKQAAEGFMERGLFATELCGPLLVRNPALLDAFAARLCGRPLPPCEEPWAAYAEKGYQHALSVLRQAAGKPGKRH